MADEMLRTPAPADIWDRIDTALIDHRLGALITADRLDLYDLMMAGELRWRISEFDSEGCASIHVLGPDGDTG